MNLPDAVPVASAPPPGKDQAARALTDLVARFTAYVARHLPQDVLDKLAELREREVKPLSKVVYDSTFENLGKADRRDRPCCQDSGAIRYFVRAGEGFPLLGELPAILGEALRQATKDAPLRHDATETFVEGNTGTDTGTNIPWIEWDIVPDEDTCTIEACMAGGVCSLPGAAKAPMTAAGYEGVADFVFDAIASCGMNACPPLLVGVGISSCVETAAALSRRAILRPLGTHHPDPQAAKMEALLEKGLNDRGIGPQGLSGSVSVMGVHIESSARNASAIGVGVCVGCWAHRRGTIRIRPDLSCEILSHKAVVL